MKENQEKEISIEDAITSWFNTVYLPVIHTIDKYKIMKYFKHRTKSDLYVWIIKYFDELKKKFGENCSLEDAVFDIKNEYKISLPTKIKNTITDIITFFILPSLNLWN